MIQGDTPSEVSSSDDDRAVRTGMHRKLEIFNLLVVIDSLRAASFGLGALSKFASKRFHLLLLPLEELEKCLDILSRGR